MAGHSNDERVKWVEVDPSDLLCLFDSTDFLYLWRKHAWLLILLPLLFGALAVYLALQMTPIYQTETSVYLRPNFDKEMQLEHTTSKLEDADSLRSIEEALVSDSVILGMVDTLELRDDPDFLGADGRFPAYTRWYRDHPSHFLVRSLEEVKSWMGDEDTGPSDSKLLKNIRDRYQATLMPNTRTVHLTVEDYNPERSVEVANALIAEFLERFRNDRSAKELELRASLAEQSEKALKEAMAMEAELEAFRSDHSDVLVEQDSTVFHDRLLAGGNALAEAESEKSKLAGMIRMLEDVDPEKDPYQVFQILANRNQDYLSGLMQMQAAAKTSFAEARQKYTARHPSYQAAQTRLDEIENTMKEYAAEMKEGVTSEHAAATEKVAELRDSLSELRGDFVGLKSTGAEFRGIKEKMDRSWETYTQLQQKILDLDLDPQVTPTFVTTMSDAVVPDEKSKPRTAFFAAGGMFLGGLAALAILAWRYRRGMPFTARDQVRKQLRIPSLGHLDLSARGDRDLGVTQLLESNELVGPLFWTRESKITQVTAIESCQGGDLVGRALALSCARNDSATLLVSFRPGLNAPSQFASPLAPKLTELELPVEVLLNPPEFRSEIRRLAMEFDQVIIDSTNQKLQEVKLAIASVAQRTLLLVTKGGIPRGRYRDFIEQGTFDGRRTMAAVFVGKMGRRKEKAAQQAGGLVPTPTSRVLWPQSVQGEFDYGTAPGPKILQGPLYAIEDEEPVTPFSAFRPNPGDEACGPFGERRRVSSHDLEPDPLY